MSEAFFERPILNSPYEHPRQHWELDDDGQPTNRVIETRRRPQCHCAFADGRTTV